MGNLVTNHWLRCMVGYLCLVTLSSCANRTYVMPMPITYPEERKVLLSHPVIPVQIKER